MEKPKAPKDLKDPKWEDGLSPEQITEAEHLYGTLAGTYVKLASIIEQADIALSNAGNIPQGSNAVEIQTGGPLYAIDDIGGDNQDWVMKQSLLTYLPVMRALYSTVKLKRKIEDTIGVKNAAKFYEDLKVALRFYDKYANVGGSYMSGDAHRESPKKKPKFLGTYYLGPLMHVRRGGPTAGDLISQVYGLERMEKAQSRKEGPRDNKSDMNTVSEVAALVDKSPARITQLCTEGKIVYEGEGRDRRVSTAGALLYFAKQDKDRVDKKACAIGRDQIKDAAEVADDERKMNRRNRI